MLRAYLTNTGLLISDAKRAWFADNEGTFRRLATPSESEYLICVVRLKEVSPPKKIYLPVKWRIVGEFVSFEDDSNYKPSLGSNGGNYSFTYKTRIYNRFTSKGSEWLKLEYSETSAGFHYDQLEGRFDSSVGRVTFVDTEDKFSLETYTDDEYEYEDQDQSILRGYGELISEEEGRGYVTFIKQQAEAAK